MSSLDKSSKETVKWQLFAGIVASLSNISYGTNLASSSIVLPSLQTKTGEEDIFLTIDQGSWFASLYSLGNLSGALTGGFQSGFFGRKKSMILDNILIIIGSTLIATGDSYYLLLAGRFLGGHGTGSCIISLPAYLSEISHPKIRGLLTGIFGAVYYIGAFIIMSLGALLPWRFAIGGCNIFPVITIVGLFFCPESPVWLLRNGKKDKAVKTLNHLRGCEEAASKALAAMEDNLNKEKQEFFLEADSSLIFRFKRHLRELTCPTFWRPFFLILYLLTVMQIWAGMPFITFYMVTFFQNMNIPMDPYLAASTISINRLVFGLASIKLHAKYSKKKLYMLIIFIMVMSTTSLGVHQYLTEKQYFKKWDIEEFIIIRMFPYLSIFVLYAGVSLGFGTIPKMLTGELLPAKKRSIGSGILGFFEGLSNFSAAKVAPGLMNLIHVYGCFTLFSINLLVGFGVVYFFLPDTGGKSLEEIENYYYNMKVDIKKKKRGILP